MKQVEKATLVGGRQVEYVVDTDKVMEGGMKQVFFTPDRSSVVCFFKDQSDVTRRMRLEAVLGKYNPTTTHECGEYWKKLFCWPTGIVETPRLGVMCPAYPANFFFKDGPFKGKEKEGTWFAGRTGGGTPFRMLMPESERGTWINYFRLCIMMARAIRRLHQAGLAHSDLSAKNILIDPSTGQSIVIDIDSLVVPGIFPPEVIGTPKFIAPEVLATAHLPLRDPNRKHPCAATDQHALAVLIYQYLLFRHPLEGPKVHSTVSAEEDDVLSMGAKALFIEHPQDASNRPGPKAGDSKWRFELSPTVDTLGPHLETLFKQAFVDGLHTPNRRPIAARWEEALVKTWDLLHPCPNARCEHKWFVFHRKGITHCPFCRAALSGTVYKLILHKQVRDATWLPDGELVVYNGRPILKWHVYDNVKPNETLCDADRELLADCQFYQGRWLLTNRKLQNMRSPCDNRVPPNSVVELKPGAQFRLSTEPHGRVAKVEVM